MAVLGSAGCAGSGSDSRSRAKLEETITAFYAAINTGETVERARFFSDDALILPNGGNPIHGREAIRNMFAAGQDALFRIRDREVLDMNISGDLAYTVNAYDYAYYTPDEEPVWYPTKNIHIWKRQPDGSWQLHADLWNSSPARD
ncbi:MAG: DUF4440 domain-containing protein, partial [Fidelibacterota bacterium]